MKATRENIIRLLDYATDANDPIKDALLKMLSDPSVQLGTSLVSRARLLPIYQGRINRGTGDTPSFQALISALLDYPGEQVQIIAITTNSRTAAIFANPDGHILSLLPPIEKAGGTAQKEDDHSN